MTPPNDGPHVSLAPEPPPSIKPPAPTTASSVAGNRASANRATTVLILGIASLVILPPAGIAAWIMGSRLRKDAKAGGYAEPGRSRIGRICGIIGTILTVAIAFGMGLFVTNRASSHTTLVGTSTSSAQQNVTTSSQTQLTTSTPTTAVPTISATTAPAVTSTSTSAPAVTDTSSWNALPAAPIEARGSAISTWMGAELLIWGGFSGGPNPHPLADGAAYNPNLQTWRMLPGAPDGARGAKVAVAWTGKEALVLATDYETAVTGARYNPSGDTWAPMAATPLSRRSDAGYVWTGEELVVIGGVGSQALAEPGGASYSPKTDTWRVVDTPAFVPRRSPKLAWTGTEVIAFGLTERCIVPGPCNDLRPSLAAYNPATGVWRQLGDSSIGEPGRVEYPATYVQHLFAVDGLLIAVTTGPARIMTFNRATERWVEGTTPACAQQVDHRFEFAPVLTGKVLVWMCGDGSIEQAALPSMAWLPTAPAPPVAPVTNAVFEPAGTGIVLWSGLEHVAFNPASAAGAFLPISP
jgi:hypothetical protein